MNYITYNDEVFIKHIRALSTLYTNDLNFNIALVRSEVGYQVAVLQKLPAKLEICVPSEKNVCLAYIQQTTGKLVSTFLTSTCLLLLE